MFNSPRSGVNFQKLKTLPLEFPTVKNNIQVDQAGTLTFLRSAALLTFSRTKVYDAAIIS